MASITKKKTSKYQIACFTQSDGTQAQRSTRTTDPKLALEIANKFEQAAKLAREKNFFEAQARKVLSDVLERAGQPRMESDTVEHFMREWLKGKENDGTRERYSGVVDLFLVFLGHKSKEFISNVNYKDIQGFLESRKAFAANTRKLEVKAIGTAFNLAKKLGLTDHNPVDKALAINPASIKGIAAKKKPFTLEQVKSLLKVAKGEWKTVILLAWNTGARLGDCAQMNWSNINFNDKVIDFISEKRDVRVYVPMTPETEQHLLDIAPNTNEPFLCPKLATKKTGGAHGLSKTFINLMLEAGINPNLREIKGRKRKHSELSFHSFRHCCNSILKNEDVDQETRMKLLAHKTADVNTGYTHIELETLRKAIAKLPSLS